MNKFEMLTYLTNAVIFGNPQCYNFIDVCSRLKQMEDDLNEYEKRLANICVTYLIKNNIEIK